MGLKCRFLASSIENGIYVTIQVRFDGDFDVIWARVDAERSIRSVFMCVLWFHVP